MKIAFGDERLFEEAKKIGKAVLVSKYGGDYTILGESLKMVTEAKNLRETIECLADLGFEFAILKGFEFEIETLEKVFGFKIPKVEKLEDLANAPELETLKSVVEKIKKGSINCGAIGVFIGVARGTSDGKKVKMLEYEAYEEVLGEKVRELEKRIRAFPGVENFKFYHKLGKILPGEDIVYIAVAGKHRKDIWAPLMLAVEFMKTELPIWKKEKFENGERWV